MNTDSHFFDKPGNIRALLRLFYVLCTVLFLLDFVIHRHVYHNLERIWGFYPLYGFLGCVVLVVIAKWMRTFLMRPEDYYTRIEDERMQRNDPVCQGGHHVDD